MGSNPDYFVSSINVCNLLLTCIDTGTRYHQFNVSNTLHPVGISLMKMLGFPHRDNIWDRLAGKHNYKYHTENFIGQISPGCCLGDIKLVVICANVYAERFKYPTHGVNV